MNDKIRDDYGYAPAVSAIIERLHKPLNAQCMPVALPVDAATRQTPCSVIEVFNASSCNCDKEPARLSARDDLLTDEMKAQGNCRCQILQLAGDAQNICRATLNPPSNSGDGWCYADPAQLGTEACTVVQGCTATEQRRIHFMNTNSEPRPGALSFIRCEAQPIAPLPAVCP